MDGDSNDFASGLSLCVTRDGQGTPTADIPWGNNHLTGVADPVNPQDAVNLRTMQAGGAVANNNIGRNLLHNALFNIQQRGAGPWTANLNYTADRFRIGLTGTNTCSIAVGVVSDAIRSQIGDESATSYLGNIVTGSANAGDYVRLIQPIENVRRLANKTVTVSFWGQSGAGLKVAVSVNQNFGTGGSPSTPLATNGQIVTLTNVWTRYSMTFSIPSVAGMTLGTNNDHATNLIFWFTAGSTFNSQTGGLGSQTGTINLWGIQLEVGSVATPLEKIDPQVDLAKCQRFYCVQYYSFAGLGGAGTASFAVLQTLPVQMRATPTLVNNNTTTTNFGNPSIGIQGGGAGASSQVYISGLPGTASQFNYSGTFTASADL
jgi:hypothetical protein